MVQPRETRPCLTERLLMGRKESNQTNKQTSSVENSDDPDQDLHCFQNRVNQSLTYRNIGPVTHNFEHKFLYFFLTNQFKHVLWVLKKEPSH